MMARVQRVTINGITWCWPPVTSRISHISILRTVTVNVFINDLNTGLERILGHFVNVSKLRRAARS